jgi:hypothetical protein
MTPSEKTDFSGLASATQLAYQAVANAEEATRSGEYQRANDGLHKPFRLAWPRLIPVKPPFQQF